MPFPPSETPWIRRVPIALLTLLAVCSAACSSDGASTAAVDDTTAEVVPLEMSVPPTDDSASFTVSPWSSPLSTPTDLAFLPDGRALATEKGGFGPEVAGQPSPARVVVLGPDGQEQGTALDLLVCSEAERGLNGIELHPDFEENGYVFLYFTRAMAECHAGAIGERPPPEQQVFNRLSRFTWDGSALDPASEVVVLDQIPSFQSAHNGGGLAFAPDGMLLVGVGDSQLQSSAPDPAQWGGKLLRVDVDSAAPPADNPFATDPVTLPQSLVHATGLRNPFALDADPVDGRIIVADLGDEEFEELDLIVPGTDYGWPGAEGPESTDAGAPVLWYSHGDGCAAIIGGQFARGGALGAEYDGWYVFGDFVCGRVWAAAIVDGATTATRLLARTDINLTNLTFGPDGALYLSGSGGVIHRLTQV